MSTSYQVDIEFKAKGGQALQQFTKQAEDLKRTVDGTKMDVLNTALGVLPGRAGAAANGILGLTRGLKEAQNQARATAAEIAALQAALASKKIQLGAKGGIGGEALKKEIAGLEEALAKGGGSGGAMAVGLGAVAVAAVAAAAGMAAVTASAVSFTNEIDRNRQQLTLFTKDVKVTNQIIASLQRTADATSLGLPGLLEATKTLSAYGIEAQNAGAATKMLGDLALGDNEKLQRFAVNFAQIASLGKAYTVDLKQFGMAGIPIFDALSKATGKSTAEIMKMAEEGKITYPLVVKALQDLTKEGASFYRGAERGGTEMDRAVQQMIGSWEKLQQKIGTAVGPAVVGAIGKIGETLDGVLGIINNVNGAVSSIQNGPLKGVFDFVFDKLNGIISFIDQHPQLAFLIPGAGAGWGINAAIRGQAAKGSKSNAAADEKGRAKLAADAQRKAEVDAKAAVKKLEEENAVKIAKINLDTERSLADARIGYEQQVADFRRQQIEKIADLERQISDERIKQEFANSQAASRSASLGGQISGDLAIASAAGAGKDTRAMQAAQDTARILEDSARARREIEFNATQRKVEIERRLSDFKRETERAMGEMQLAYARQTDGILRQAGQSINDLMVKGAKEAKEILESVQMGGGGGGGGGGGATIASIADSSLNANARAWLAAIRSAEGTAGPNGYRTMFGGGLFSDMSRHPDRVVRSGGYASAAAGAYQFMPDTWRSVGGGAMTPVRQDRAAMALALNRGVDLSTAAFTPQNVARLAPEWASLPTLAGKSYYGQPNRSFQSLQGVFSTVRGGAVQAAAAPAAPVLPAANNIVPTGSIPTTSPGLQAANAGLVRAAEEDKRLQLLREEQQITADLNGSYKALTVEQQSSLKAAQDKNKIDQAALGLIRDGVKPELANQLATNQQLVENKTQELQLLRDKAAALVNEKDITAETKAERQKILDSINAQISAQPGLLGQLNAEAQQTQAIADQRAAMDQAKSDAQGISSTITGGLKDAIKAAVTGGDVKAALSGMLASLGEKFLDMAMRPLEQMLTQSLTQMFNPQALATRENTAATVANTAAIQAAAAAGGGGGGGFGGGGILGGLGSLFGGGGGFAGAFSSGFGSSWGGFAGALSMPLLLADGGFATGPTPAVIGEGGANEYVIPENKMNAAMARWNGGVRGEAVVSGADPTGRSGGTALAEAPPQVSITGGILNFNDSHYIRADQVPSIISQSAKQGEARALRKLQQSPGARRKVGI
jgi:tape measure domain-containing protein